MPRFLQIPLFTILCLFSGTLCAVDYCCETCGCFDGFFVGAAGGVATNFAETKTHTNYDYAQSFSGSEYRYSDERVNCDTYEFNGWGEIFGGWGRQCSTFYLGGRFGMNFSHFEPKAHSSSFGGELSNDGVPQPADSQLNNELKTKLRAVEYTLDFKPGIIFCDKTMLFGVVGAAFNKERLKGKSTLTVPDDPALIHNPSILLFDKTKSSAGLRGGIGLEHMLCPCLSLQLSYVYTCYWSLSDNIRSEYAVTPSTSFYHEADFSTKASKQVTSLGLAYYF